MDPAGFRDHRVRSGGVPVGSICGCGRIANWTRVTGSGDAADHQRSGRRGGARIPLPRRARPWIQAGFRDHRVRSGGVRVGSICGCGRIANWSRVTGSGDAADHQRSGRRGGTRIPLPRRARTMDPAGFRDHRVRSGGVRVGSISGCGRIANWTRVTGSGDAADDQRSRRLGGARIPLPRRARPWIQQALGTTVFARAACGSVPFPDAAASRIGPGSPGRVTRLITSAVGGAAARGSRCRVGPDHGSSSFRDHRVRSGGVRVGSISGCGRIANWSRVTGSGDAADHQRSGRLGGTRIPLPRRARPWIQQALGTTVFARAACGSVPFPDAAASRIGPGSRGRVTRLMTSAVGGSAARGSRCRVGPDHGSSRFRDHRVRSGGVRVGSISGCGRIANWSRVTGSGDAADDQRSRRRGGARIPLPRRARPWIQQV
jgi:hypothetical protein